MKMRLFLTLCLAGGTFPSFAVRNGTATNAHHKKVFLLLSDTEEMTNLQECTAWGYRYKRCVATAAHCAAAVHILANGQSPKTSPEEKTTLKTLDARPGWVKRWTDVAVGWANIFTSTEGLMDAADFEVFGTDPNMGIGSVEHSATFPGNQSSNTPKQAAIYGYGHNNTVSGTDVGSGTKRTGSPLVYNYVKGSSQNTPRTGSYYTVVPKTGDGNPTRIGCAGDSGMPLLVGSDVFGIYSSSAGNGSTECEDHLGNFFAAIDDSKIGTDLSNEAWMKKKADEICGKNLAIIVEPSGASAGYVSGSISGGYETYSEDVLDDDILCGDGASFADCFEMIHENEGVELEAVANSGYQFVEWQDGFYSCPCAASSPSNPVCEISFGDLGYYPGGDPDHPENFYGYDDGECVAVFEEVEEPIDP